MKVICAGIRRSGSTWLFNAVKSIFKASGVPIKSCFVSPFVEFNWTTNEVIKIHHFDQRLCDESDYVLTTRRDWRDIVASAVRRGRMTNDNLFDREFGSHSIKQARDFLLEEIANYKFWKPHSDLEIYYPNIVRSKTEVISEIASVLDLNVDVEIVHDIMSGIKPPIDGVDQETQLWHNHITDGGCNTFYKSLSTEVIQMIEEITYEKNYL